MATNPAAPMITDQGNADNTIEARAAAIKAFDKYRIRYNCSDFEDMTKEDFEKKDILCKFAHYLVNTHLTQKDENLMMNSCDEYLRRVMNCANTKFEGGDFYRVLDPNFPKPNWFSKLL